MVTRNVFSLFFTALSHTHYSSFCFFPRRWTSVCCLHKLDGGREREVGFHAYFHTRWFNDSHISCWRCSSQTQGYYYQVGQIFDYIILSVSFNCFVSSTRITETDGTDLQWPVCRGRRVSIGFFHLGHEPCGIECRKHPPLCVYCCGYAECLEWSQVGLCFRIRMWLDGARGPTAGLLRVL